MSKLPERFEIKHYLCKITIYTYLREYSKSERNIINWLINKCCFIKLKIFKISNSSILLLLFVYILIYYVYMYNKAVAFFLRNDIFLFNSRLFLFFIV